MQISPLLPDNSSFQRAVQLATAFALVKLAVQVGANVVEGTTSSATRQLSRVRIVHGFDFLY